jgi:2-methylcitrate dehydratase PrpD
MNEISVSASVGLTRKIADFAGGVRIEAAPATVVQNAKLAILDCLGVSIVALSQEVGQATLRFARDNAGHGSCTIWGAALTVNARDAALCNGILSHGLDYDDRNHSSTFTLAAAAAAAEQDDISGERLLEAFIVGREVRNSLDKLFSDRNSGIGPGAKGWHSNGILGSIAAACSAGNALRLDSAQMLDCVGLSAGSCGALTRDGGTMAKPFRTGHAAATGLACALLARSGFSADETVLEGRFGLLDALSPIPDAALGALGKDLGVKFHLETGIKSKPMASCTATHSATEAMLRLSNDEGINPRSVESIECDLKPYPLVRQFPGRGVEGRFSMPFCLAVALAHRRLRHDDFTDDMVREPAIQDLMKLTKHIPGSTTLTVKLKDGTVRSEPLQAPSNFTGVGEIDAKFHDCVDGILTDTNAAKIVELTHSLEKLGSVRQLMHLLRTGDCR